METYISQYLKNVKKLYSDGIATEHSYRSHLENLVKNLVFSINITNEPRRQKCGAPDYVITTKDNIPVSYIEAKDIGKPLDKIEKDSQLKRYRESLDNLILTDYLEFRFFKEDQKITTIKLAQIENNSFKEFPENFETFANLLRDFCVLSGQTIKSSLKLSKMMAAKAKLLKDIMQKAIENDEAENDFDSSLKQQMEAFKSILIHDITPSDFADIYAQTIAYGMFAARLHDETLDTFSRFEAATLIPKTNPFLRKLFQYIAGYDLDVRISWVIDALADIFRATDVSALLQNFGKSTQQNDPIIHFYETFLSEYDPKLRKSRGVWYTPEPVVKFIVRAVDDILKTEFGLPQGLADTSKTEIEVDSQVIDNRSKSGYKRVKQDIHKVQILDPATGTGTFLAEVIKQIYTKFQGQQGIWSKYVEDHLIPRLNGFELLMASYSMAHLKLDMLLRETGYKPKKEQRFRVYLTNSLEEYHPATGTIFASWLSNEANEANYVKRDTPVMVILGNPPYSVSSSNKSKWIENLMVDYKKDLNERNINPLSDDYIKFIRYAQYFIEKNSEGILAYISNNSFIDGLIHRKMRESLLKAFDKIYILDLHGSSKKNETDFEGNKDENVFDIQQGVSINIFVKNRKKKSNLAELFYSDISGRRNLKYEKLLNNGFLRTNWLSLDVKEPYYFFIPKNFDNEDEYNCFIPITKLFNENNSGLKTEFDDFVINFNYKESKQIFEDLRNSGIKDILEQYQINNKNIQKVENAKNDINLGGSDIISIIYRPFDQRSVIYTGRANGVMGRPRHSIMKHLVSGNNISLLTCRQQSTFNFQHVFVSKFISDMCSISLQTKETGYVFPLYLYPETNEQQNMLHTHERTPNLNLEIVKEISEKLSLTFTNEKEETENTFAPIDLLDYIYAVLHSPNYREKYKEFLKIDFPRIPYPTDKETFWKLVALGGELRQIHLLESPKVEKYITTYPEDGDNKIIRKITKNDFVLTPPENKFGKVWINKEQYFDNVPLIAWEFYIGGYQPAQKWLKDRTDRELSFDEILHYQKIIVALTETDKIMKEIDNSIEF